MSTETHVARKTHGHWIAIGVGLVAGVVVFFGASLLSSWWLNSPAEPAVAVVLGLIIAFVVVGTARAFPLAGVVGGGIITFLLVLGLMVGSPSDLGGIPSPVDVVQTLRHGGRSIFVAALAGGILAASIGSLIERRPLFQSNGVAEQVKP